MNPTKLAEEMKRLSRGWSDDMSPEAVHRRLEILSQLYDAWLTLKKSVRVYPPLADASEKHEPQT
jgi:hypothetical protein